MSAEELLRSAFDAGRPCVLLLGQAGPPTGLLDKLLARKGRDAGGTWGDALVAGMAREDYEWLTERFEHSVVPESTQQVLELPWSAVFTSSLDPRLQRRLETRGRQPEAITSSEHFPRAPRSTARPPIHYLFGRSSDVSETSRCPATTSELIRRRARHSSVLLSRLAETVTPVGLLVVAGYDPARDWLALDDLLGALPSEGTEILWTAACADVLASPLFGALQQSGELTADARDISAIVADMTASSELVPRGYPVLSEPGVISFEGDDFAAIAPSLRLRVEASAAIVDDDWTKPPDPLSKVMEQDLFHRFHGDPGSARAILEGVARGFAIERSFEATLHGRVKEVIANPSARNRVVVLHGQSGTGKSIALARLALTARTSLRVPVLFAEHRVPEAADVDAFCEEMDRGEHGPTLLLCDGNAPPERYFVLADSLGSRGRRFVIAATAYRLEQEEGHRGFVLVEAPDATSPDEKARLVALVRRFGSNEGFSSKSIDEDEHVLPLLYRLLSAGRARLASGLSGEARSTEDLLRVRGRAPRRVGRFSLMARRMVEAGLHSGEETLFAEVEEVAHGEDAAGRLIDYVMAAGRVDIDVPVNLLLRALRARASHLDYHHIAEMFRGLDLFRWRHGDEERTELLIGARLRLEAELICRRRLAYLEREVDCLVELIEAVRPRGIEQDSELKFLLDLLQALDEKGPRGNAYARGGLRLGRALTTLRQEQGVEDASLMLQESNFRRAWLEAHRDDELTRDQRDLVLDEARDAVETAIAKIDSGQIRTGRRTRQYLFVERASIYGFLASGHARAGDSHEIVWSDYLAARIATRKAMSTADSYFPFDVALWTPADILERAGASLSPDRRAELVADIHATMDVVDLEDLSPRQLMKFNSRRAKLGSVLKDKQLEEAALRDLEASNSHAAVFLRARAMCASALSRESNDVTQDGREQAKNAAAYLRERFAVVGADLRTSRLLLELEWIVDTGERLLRGARRRVPAGNRRREDLLLLVREVRGLAGDAADSQLSYLEGVLLWLLDDVQHAETIWRELAHETEFEDRRRVVRRLIVTDAMGQPVLHRGRLLEPRTPGKWSMELEGGRSRVDLLERDFRGLTFRRGAEVRDFWVAFNYLGAIADPPARREGDR